VRAYEFDGGRRFPIQTGDRSELDKEYGFGARLEIICERKLKIIRRLSDSAANPTLEGAVH
jgi:hypothetical protein